MTDTLRDVLADVLIKECVRRERNHDHKFEEHQAEAEGIIAALAARNVVLARGDHDIVEEDKEDWLRDHAARGDAPTPEYIEPVSYQSGYEDGYAVGSQVTNAPTPEPLREAAQNLVASMELVEGEHPIHHVTDCAFCELRAALAAREDARPPEPEYDADGDPIRPDPHSIDWYDGYAAAMRDVDAARSPEAPRFADGFVAGSRYERAYRSPEAPALDVEVALDDMSIVYTSNDYERGWNAAIQAVVERLAASQPVTEKDRDAYLAEVEE